MMNMNIHEHSIHKPSSGTLSRTSYCLVSGPVGYLRALVTFLGKYISLGSRPGAGQGLRSARGLFRQPAESEPARDLDQPAGYCDFRYLGLVT